MNRNLATLIGAQFLSAFADNAVLFAVIAMTLQQASRGEWYIPALQSAFILAFIVLTPWVGKLADRHSKPVILIGANLIKALGALLITLGIEPLLGYGIIGMGAASYGPAKYGIIPELSKHDELVKANGWVEGATIAAILSGTVAGARIADDSIEIALYTVASLYLVSGLSTLLLPRKAGVPVRSTKNSFEDLFETMRVLLRQKQTRLTLIGLSLFWAIAATLRVLLVAWAPEVLGTKNASQIADLTFFMALGIVLGSGVVPRLISLDQTRRTRFPAYLLAILLMLLAPVTEITFAKGILVAIGICGGAIVVPLNAAIQQIGYQGVGSGRAVAAQNFFQNTCILFSMALYTLAAALGAKPEAAMLTLGGLAYTATFLIGRILPPLEPKSR